LLKRSNLIWLALALLLAASLSLLLPLGTTSTVTIEWTTASELNTAGFNLYRSDTATDNYVRLNAELIPGSTDPLTGGAYRYVDRSVIAGRTYYYQLEDIETGGASTRHEPYQVVANASSGFNGLTLGLIAAAVIAGLVGLTGRQRAAHA
jgi:hypothetical protein